MLAIGKERRNKVKKFLQDRGQEKEKIERAKLENDDDLRNLMCEVHGVTVAQYQKARSGKMIDALFSTR